MSKCAEFKFDLICEIIFDKFFPGLTGIRTISLSISHSESLCDRDYPPDHLGQSLGKQLSSCWAPKPRYLDVCSKIRRFSFEFEAHLDLTQWSNLSLRLKNVAVQLVQVAQHQCYSYRPGSLGGLESNKEIQPYVLDRWGWHNTSFGSWIFSIYLQYCFTRISPHPSECMQCSSTFELMK